MKLRSYISGSLLLIIFVLTTMGCPGKEKPDSKKKLPEELYPHEFMRRLETINPGLRDPASIIYLIEETGATFMDNLVNSGDSDPIYQLDSALSALNLGVYTVDIAYLATYNRKEEIRLQLDKARTLAGNIGAGHIYDHAMYRNFETMGVHRDTLISLLKNASEQLEHDLSEMELMRIYTLFATGVFIEKLHLTTQLLNQADKENADRYWDLMVVFFYQEKSLDTLIKLLDNIRRREEGERFMAMLNDLKHIYMELSTREELAGIRTSNITQNRIYQDLVDQIARIREQIVDPVYP